MTIPLRPLQVQVGHLVDDLRGQVTQPEAAELLARLRKEHADAVGANRLAATFETWLDDVLDQAAVAWVLGCVFVRFCEDNRLVEPVWIGGPELDASVETALANRQAHLITNFRENDRHWLRLAFAHLSQLPATGRLFDKHNPLWHFHISGQAAENLSDFFRKGAGFVSLRDEKWNTRFLGTLYQDLSQHARKTYALLQTPEFVEEFILDRTLKPALEEFGLEGIKLIDPACGSGHFLLGAFDKLLKLWVQREPGTPMRTLVDRTLEQVTGVDINPFAVSIARFRLMLAATQAYGQTSLEGATAFSERIATGDSLLPLGDYKTVEQADILAELQTDSGFTYSWEDADLLRDFLNPSQYTVVVGNPPYIVVRDKARNNLYRGLYDTCHRQYALSVPFAERFFELAKRGNHDGNGAGVVGQITSNSFMKREFGSKLINEFFAGKVELTEVIDTSGAFIPGHGTPTVILIGRNRLVSPRYSGPIRAILGVQGEPGEPANPAEGLVWKAIEHQIDTPSASQWVSSTDLNRGHLSNHPWSLAGGGAERLLATLESLDNQRLGSKIREIGFGAVTREDSAYMVGEGLLRRTHVPEEMRRLLIEGEATRDWRIEEPTYAIWPYDENSLAAKYHPAVGKLLWPVRWLLVDRVAYGKNQISRGLQWFEYSMFFANRYRTPLSIAYGEVATHNHFVLDRGGKVFNRTAPVIKLPERASEDDHLRLLGVLNSSLACFWLKQVSFNKGNGGIGGGIGDEDWEPRYQFGATKIANFPLPGVYPVEIARRLDGLAQRLSAVTPAVACEVGKVPTREGLDRAKAEYLSIRAEMITWQEELDWEVYLCYGLIGDDLSAVDDPEPLRLGERAFEVIMARDEVETAWFERHGSTRITELPSDWREAYRDLVERRITAIRADRNLQLLERPECKRRWQFDGWEKLEKAALEDWLRARLEAPQLWSGTAPQSAAELAEKVRNDNDFRQVALLWSGRDEVDQTRTISELIRSEHVPFLAAYRYKPSGLAKRAQWERCWRLQRLEDEGKPVEIQVPPKYASADFANSSFWSQRGKLDVPKERFISYPQLSRDGDPTLLLGWAGWDHEQQAKALATVYLDRKVKAGWAADRLLPLLAGLVELEPWLHQWHGEPAAGYPGSPAEFYSGLIDTELSVHGADRARLTNLRGVQELS